jgi:hypothetical protein
MDLAKEFMALFDGLEKAYGTYEVNPMTTRADGKVKGLAVTKKAPVTLALWQGHLGGKLGIGIIPIKDNSKVRFAAIDIDVYQGLNHVEIIKKVEEHKFPLIACRSKSGGCHLFLFTKEELPAELVRRKMREMAAVLGHGNAEIYPRQDHILVERGDMGQWINMPYFNGIKGLRYAIDSNGAALGPEDFLKLAAGKRVGQPDLEGIKVEVKPDLDDGPPCLQHLTTIGFAEGTRNDGLFNLGVYVQKAYPDTWKDKLEEFNLKYMDPPLHSGDVQGVVKSLEKKDYGYTCDKAPVNAYCNRALCLIRKFGIGGGSSMPSLDNLTKYDANPPIWFINVEGVGRLELTTEELQNPIRFQKRCIECLNLCPPILNKAQWGVLIQKLLEKVTIIEAPADASPSGQLFEHLERFCTGRAQAAKPEEMLLGKPWTNGGKHYFRMSDFTSYLNRQHFNEFKVNKITSMLKDQLKAEHVFMVLKGKGTNLWVVPEFSKQSSSHDVPEFPDMVPF